MTDTATDEQLLTTNDVAELLRVEQRTVYVWQQRNRMPAPDETVANRKLWKRSTIVEWARSTGRLPAEQ